MNQACQKMENREYASALEDISQLLKEAPDNYPVWRLKATALQCLGKNEDALKAYDKALSLNSADPDVWYDKGALLSKIGRPDQARQTFEEAIKGFPDNYRLWGEYGLSLAILSRIEEGLNAIDKALELEKKDPVLWRLKATVLKSLDREREAEAAEQEADKIAPDPELSKEGILCQRCRGEEVVKLQQ